ncbi:MAG: hypothetical protein KDJ90_12115, partial [Nitratireductor sp.]|nr:hypothetical protein [Nitratireductor sp.]
GVSHWRDYSKPRNSASIKDSCRAECRRSVQNGAGTRSEKWHKTDTRDSSFVPVDAQKETAAPTAIGNGGAIEYRVSNTDENFYHGQTDAATLAARWYAENRETCPRPIVPTLRTMFGLSSAEAVWAVMEATGGAR